MGGRQCYGMGGMGGGADHEQRDLGGGAKKSRFLNLRVWLPSLDFKIKQFKRPEISNSDPATCWGGTGLGLQECLEPKANFSAR